MKLSFFFLLLASYGVCSKSESDRLQTLLSRLRTNFLDSLSSFSDGIGIPGVDPEADMTFCEICDYHGYKCEEYLHEVVTEDGFLLTMHRITGRKDGIDNSNSTKPPVFVQHGLLCDSTSWILNLPNESLPFILSDAGFDVWLGNSRGSTYSVAHKTLKPDTDAFWAWSWDEMAMFDIPASIDLVLNNTGYEKLHYVAHSQGTLTGFVHLSNIHSSKILHMIALGPVFKVAHMRSALVLLAPFANDIADILELVGYRDFLPNSNMTKWLADNLCNELSPFHFICADFVFAMAGIDVKQLNESRLPVYLTHTPAGTSVRNMMHYVQMYKSKDCSRYDYGSAEKNVQHYGTPIPPAYNLSTITNTPVTMYWAENDWLADPKDVAYIIGNLKTLRSTVYIPVWDHLDFIWAIDAATVLYNDIAELIHLDLSKD